LRKHDFQNRKPKERHARRSNEEPAMRNLIIDGAAEERYTRRSN
jgi:hypothetical protein